MEWNADLYDGRHGFVSRYGKGLLEYVPANKSLSVLDLGCGTGTLTKELSLRAGEVSGVDASGEMIRRARELYPGVKFEVLDALAMEWENKWDIVFSNAVFHWIPRHDRLLANVFRCLKKGGRLVCEFGAKGNIGRIEGAFSRALSAEGYTYKSPFCFPASEDYARLLEAEGFAVEELYDYDRPTPLEDGEKGLENWMRQFFAGHLKGVPPDACARLFRQVEQELKPSLWDGTRWVADYRRMRVVAVKL